MLVKDHERLVHQTAKQVQYRRRRYRRFGVRGTDLSALPKTSVQVDGSKAYVTLELAVRWPAVVAEVTGQVRRHVRDRVQEMAGLQVDEVHIVVADLATDITPPPRVR